jgi:UDP-N-acetylmuramoylalanine--D-glutamate ligase
MAKRDYFAGKRIAMIGLGPHGEMVTDAKYLIKAGALVSIYDLKSEARLKTHLIFLRSVGLANYVCGSIPSEDLLDMDLIILSHEYPRNSTFLSKVKEKGIPIEYPETLFFRLSPPITLIGIMGNCGKATVFSMLEPMLGRLFKNNDDQQFFAMDPESANGIIAHIKKIKSGDIVLLRITEDMMKELTQLGISPHVSVLTSIPEKNAYTKHPFEILERQTYNNYIIGSDHVIDATYKFDFHPKAKMIRTKASLIPAEWGFVGNGAHDIDNASLALETARLFKVDDEIASDVLTSWKTLKGRLELVKKVKNVEFYNDSASISPISTLTGMTALSSNRNIILIIGGADNEHDYRELFVAVPQYAHTIISVPGSGTVRERCNIRNIEHVDICDVPSIEEAVILSLEKARKGDKILFSPGFGAVGVDISRKERGERFVKAVRSLS